MNVRCSTCDRVVDPAGTHACWSALAPSLRAELAAAQHTTEGASDDEADAIKATLASLLAMLRQAHQTLAGGMHTAQASKDHVQNYSGRL